MLRNNKDKVMRDPSVCVCVCVCVCVAYTYVVITGKYNVCIIGL